MALLRGLFLVGSVHRSNFLFRCGVRVRATRFRQWRSEGVCAREIIRGKANRNDQETEEEPLISVFGAELKIAPQVSIKNPGKLFRELLSAKEQEILLHSRSAKSAPQGALQENWCLA